MIAVMAGAGKGLAKLSSVQPEPLVERLQPIQREDGKTRLWKADLSGYERNLILPRHSVPDALGHCTG